MLINVINYKYTLQWIRLIILINLLLPKSFVGQFDDKLSFPILQMLLKALLFFLTTLFLLVAGEVNICFKLGSTPSNGETLEKASTVFQDANEEIKNIIETNVGDTKPYDNFHLNLTHPAITVSADFSDGLNSWSTPTIRLWTLKPEGLEIFNITVDTFFSNGNYSLEGFIGDNLFNIYGNGIYSINFTKFSIAAFTALNINKTALCIPITINIYLERCQNNLQNLMDGEEELDPLINKIFEKLIPEATRIIWREEADAADSYIQEIIDKILNRSTTTSLQKLLQIFADNKDKLTSHYIDSIQNNANN